MLNVLRWLLMTAGLILLIVGLVQVNKRIGEVVLPEPVELTERKAKQIDRLLRFENLQAAVQRDAVLLRDYLLTGNKELQAARMKLWEERIQPALLELEQTDRVELAQEADGEKAIEQLDIIISKLEDLGDAETDISEVAFTPLNEPALDIFQREIALRHGAMRERLTKAIELGRATTATLDAGTTATTATIATTATLPAAPENRDLREFLVLTRSQLDSSMVDLEFYLRTGLEVYRENFEVDFTNLQQTMQNLQERMTEFNAAQHQVFDGFMPLYDEWQKKLPDATEQRAGPDWNIALRQLDVRVRKDLMQVLDANAVLHQKLATAIKQPEPIPGTATLAAQLEALKKTLWLLVAAIVAVVLASVLSLAPASRSGNKGI